MICRIHCDGTGAEWPLSRKFGCEPDYAADILEHAHKLGLVPHGISFHVGSQQHNVEAWDRALASTAAIFRACAERGITLVHGQSRRRLPGAAMCARRRSSKSYGKAIFRSLRKHFGNDIPNTIVEPGRGLVGNAGMIEAEVVLIAKRSPEDEVRWVYLDIGKFHGLAETIDESIRYPIRTRKDRDEMAPCIIAGPTCNSVDVLYEKTPYPLPVSLAIGDKVLIEAAGAYTDDLFVGRLQRLSAAAAICDLTRRSSACRRVAQCRPPFSLHAALKQSPLKCIQSGRQTPSPSPGGGGSTPSERSEQRRRGGVSLWVFTPPRLRSP